MNPTVIALSAAVLGLLIGVVSMLAVQRSERQRARWADVEEPTISDGAAEVLAVIGRAYMVVDAVDGVVQASPGAYALGLVRGHTVVSDELLEMIDAVRSKGIIVEKEIILTRGFYDQSRLVIDLRVAPVGDEYILVLADDRTEITRAQTVRTDFVANVSHELKTPVGAVGLMAEAIESSADDPESVLYFSGKLKKESRRLAALVQDVIELSRLQSADMVLSSTLVDVEQVVAESVDRNRLTAEGKNIELLVGGKAPRPVHGDPELLGTALRNLIENAIRYSPENTKVGIGMAVKGDTVRISVKDQGPGIPEDEQDRIFERFYRVDPARSRQTGGTGLGLSIVKHIVGQHGGEVTLWSQPGSGSTFTIALPSVDEETEQDLLGEHPPTGSLTQITDHNIHTVPRSAGSAQTAKETK
ncbi:sensor histidine kinase [Rothia nasimurium]|uniref:sensor histidine kinase n=1 Tax=Rothia nasimurium TaxID=85336 RepID=UPI001F326A49|nr:ATP-binding protein [Rothia nasimurium]